MNRKISWIVVAAVVLAVAAPVFAAEEKKPDMSAEEQAMMEAWMKAGTPGKPTSSWPRSPAPMT